jgi:hypothetical protein
MVELSYLYDPVVNGIRANPQPSVNRCGFDVAGRQEAE